MLYGDSPVKINEHQDALGLNRYTLLPNIFAVRQSENLYAYCTGNPIGFVDINGTFVISTTVLVVAGLAAIGAAIGGYIGNKIADSKGPTGWEKAGYIAGGAVVGGVVGGAAGYVAAPAIASATGVAGISVSTAGVSTVTTVGTVGLIVPEYVHNAGSFINWTKDAFRNTKQVLNLAQVKELFSLARQYNISIAADLNGHIGTAWEIPHIHLGDARIHVAVAKEAIEWIINNLS